MLNDIKLMLDIKVDDQDALLQLMCNDAMAAVRDYCNRKDFPSELTYVARELVIAAFKLENEGNVSSIKRGDTQISYNGSISTDMFTDKQKQVMNRYRKVILG